MGEFKKALAPKGPASNVGLTMGEIELIENLLLQHIAMRERVLKFCKEPTGSYTLTQIEVAVIIGRHRLAHEKGDTK